MPGMKYLAPFASALALALVGCGGSQATPAPAPVAHADDHDHDHDHDLGHRFEHADDWVKVFEGPERDRWQKPAELVKLLAIQPGMTAVDLGAGTGYFMPYLSKAVGPTGKLLALDVEPDMVHHMAERASREGYGNVEARQVPYDDPDLAEASVDRILIVDTWHHIADRKVYAGKLARALKPGGSVWVVDFTRESKVGPPVEHRIAPDVVAGELAAGGLATEVMPATAEPLDNQYIVVARKR